MFALTMFRNWPDLPRKTTLRYFLLAIGGMSYVHEPKFAPTQAMLDAYRKHKGEWTDYEKQFLELMASRRIEEVIGRDALEGACLLCSEDKPHRCHRRLVAEYLKEKWGDLDIVHL